MSGIISRAESRLPDGTLAVGERSLTLGRTSFKRTDDGTELLNINGLASGTSSIVWNGTGASDTGGDWTASGDGSESASADAGSGTNGWDSGSVGANDYTEFNNGSEIDVAGTYATLEFKLQPKAYPGPAQIQIQWRNAATTVIGTTLNIENYVPNMDLDVWKTVSIPIADFNLTGNVQRLRIVYKIGNQRHYIDDVQLIQSGGSGPKTFRIEAPDASTGFYLSMAVLLINAPAAGWASNAFGNIAGGLTNGLLMRHIRKSTSEVLWSFNTTNNVQLFGQYHPQESFTFSDDNLLVGFMVKPGKATILITNDDVLEYVVRDDLSSIVEMRAYAHYGIEVVS